VALAAACAAALPGCMPGGPPKPVQAFAGRPPPEFHTYPLPDGRKIFAAETGNPAGPLVLFIHGTPGGWHDFAKVMARPDLAAATWMIAVDRPGWGRSAAGGLEPSLVAQAAALRAVLEAHPKNLPAIVVGWSLGGPIAVRVAMDSPELVEALVIVAGSIDPAQEKVLWYQFIARLPGMYFFIPKMLVRADLEIIPLKGELVEMLPRWGEIKIPVTVIQGDNDDLVPPENADFAKRELTHAQLTVVRVPNQGHLIPWQRPELMAQAILGYAAKWHPPADAVPTAGNSGAPAPKANP
jgi:pimeloyl-ACP methyl ester carboxylesterase